MGANESDFVQRVLENSRGKVVVPAPRTDPSTGRLRFPCPVLVVRRPGVPTHLRTIEGVNQRDETDAPLHDWGYGRGVSSLLAKAVLQEVGMTRPESLPFVAALANAFNRIGRYNVDWSLSLDAVGVQVLAAVSIAESQEGRTILPPTQRLQQAFEVGEACFVMRHAGQKPFGDGMTL